jgi:retron-type reverse transcriptase
VERSILIGRQKLAAGVVDEGTSQGGPLSPLLSNIVLDEFDQELERRGLRFAAGGRGSE